MNMTFCILCFSIFDSVFFNSASHFCYIGLSDIYRFEYVYHLYRMGWSDNKNCVCGDIRSTGHILHHCAVMALPCGITNTPTMT